MLKENWMAGKATSTTTNIISYILQMRDKLQSCRGKVKEHMQEAQHKHIKRYGTTNMLEKEN